jgi:membrane carboxypeptidase/penicillin-binding protein
MIRRLHFITLGLCVAAVAAVAVPAVAQSWKNAGSKAAGYYSEYHGHSSHSHLYSAQNHVSHYSKYLSTAETVDPSVARMAHDSIGNHLAKTQQHLGQMKNQAAVHKNADAVKAISEVEDHVQNARLHQADLNKITIQKPIESKAAKSTVEKMQVSIEKAIQGHGKLLETLGIEKPTTKISESK